MRVPIARQILPLLLSTLFSLLAFRLLDPSTFRRFQDGILHPSLYGHRHQEDYPRLVAQQLLGKTHVAVFDEEAFHEEVHGAVLWALHQYPDIKVSFYRPPWRWGFEKVIASWWGQVPLDPKTFIDDLQRDTSIRHIFLPTFDFSGRDWNDVSPHLQRIWEERKEDEKFNIVGMRHWGKYDQTREIAWWAERDAISFVTLGDHVTKWLQTQHRKRADIKGRFSEAEADGLRRMRIRTFVPIFPPDPAEPQLDRKRLGDGDEDQAVLGVQSEETLRADSSTLDMALIQSGSWDEEHRGMNVIFQELQAQLDSDPALWGYERDENGIFIPLVNATSRSTIKLLGAGGIGIPLPLKALFQQERRLSYLDYFDRVHAADIVLPAFGTEPYGQNRASSTMGLSATGRTPLLVTQDIANSYGWFCPAYSEIRPESTSEIEFIRQVRAGIILWRSRATIKAQLKQCQEEWTERNMLLLAELFGTRPDPLEPADQTTI